MSLHSKQQFLGGNSDELFEQGPYIYHEKSNRETFSEQPLQVITSVRNSDSE
ncbi:hypothetical protein BPOR_0739g00050 [Botrytis porri]|uniref:Uncharacterized protein n=1 Tax=Botrytis porri TaxID=87229 RepID=A0A4Z1KA64_9HELO|nr:hypothetical protein BPOR_0739g00050 [Botrytis porri]